MKKILIAMLVVISLMFGGILNAGIIYDKVICKTDSFTDKITCSYSTKNITNFSGLALNVYIDGSKCNFMLINVSEDWELMRQNRIILFKIDGVLHRKKYKLDTRIGSGYVMEFVQITLDKEFVFLIANSKECKIRVGHSKETFINQECKDKIKELLNKKGH